MNVTWVGGTAATFIASGASIGRAAPSGLQDGDCLIAFLYTRSTPTPPAGWSQIGATAGFLSGGPAQYLYAYKKDAVVAADSGATFTWTQSASGRAGLTFAAVRGGSVREVNTATADHIATSNITPFADTATMPGEIFLFGASSTTANISSDASTPPTGATLWTGAAAELRLAGAYQARNLGQANSGIFVVNTASSADNGTGAITIRVTPTQWDEAAPLTTKAPAALAPTESPAFEAVPPLTAPALLSPPDDVAAFFDEVPGAAPTPLVAAPGEILQEAPALAVLASALFPPAQYTVFSDDSTAVRVYQVRLEKAGLPPLILPPRTISVRSALEGRQSSITVTIPELAQIDAIADRASGGQIVFAGGYRSGGVTRLNDILTLPLTDIKPDEGTTNKSLTLTARGASPAAMAKSVTVAAIEYQAVNGLKRLLRAPVNVSLLPGDTVVTGAATWTVGEIVYALGDGGESMTVTEA